MNKHLSGILFIIICICCVPAAGLPCTTFVLDNNGQPVYGKNMDWTGYGPCFVIVNKRGVAKTSMSLPQEPDAKNISWTSKFGSVTFNWYFGREFPFEGINEAGLFVSTMGLAEDTKYPPPDSRPPLHAFQWVQYQLDNFSTVDEVIATDQNIRQQGSFGCHFLVSDSKGNCASIEWLDGKMVCHTGEDMPVKTLTNRTYDQSLEVLNRFKGFGGYLPVPRGNFWLRYSKGTNSLLRFVRAADLVQQFDPQTSESAIDYAFGVLSKVAQPERYPALTVWSAVYDGSNKQIHFRSWNNKEIRHFDMNAFDFSCTTQVKALDIIADFSGDVTDKFVDYTKEIDLEMMEGWEPPLSDEAKELYSTYPEKYTSCAE